MSGTFTLSWVVNGRRITTDDIPADADTAATNIAVADATRKDRREMLRQLTTAKRALTLAERGFADASTVTAAMMAEERELDRECNNAHTLTCRARKVKQAKVVTAAKEEVRRVKNILYGAAYGAGQNGAFSKIYGDHPVDVVAVAVAKAAKAAEEAETARVKALDALNEMLALKASLSSMDAAIAADIAQWGNNN